MSDNEQRASDDWATTLRTVHVEVLPALRMFEVHSVEATRMSGASSDAIALQLRDARGMRVPRQNVPPSLLTRLEELVAVLLAHSGGDDAVIRIGGDDF